MPVEYTTDVLTSIVGEEKLRLGDLLIFKRAAN
jgi:hypothetical protein